MYKSLSAAKGLCTDTVGLWSGERRISTTGLLGAPGDSLILVALWMAFPSNSRAGLLECRSQPPKGINHHSFPESNPASQADSDLAC